MKNLPLHNVSNHRNFYQNQFINEYAKKKKAKISESQSFLVRYRRTYLVWLNNEKLSLKVKLLGEKKYFVGKNSTVKITVGCPQKTWKYRVSHMMG